MNITSTLQIHFYDMRRLLKFWLSSPKVTALHKSQVIRKIVTLVAPNIKVSSFIAVRRILQSRSLV